MTYTTHLLQLSVIKVFKKSVNQNLHKKNATRASDLMEQSQNVASLTKKDR